MKSIIKRMTGAILAVAMVFALQVPVFASAPSGGAQQIGDTALTWEIISGILFIYVDDNIGGTGTYMPAMTSGAPWDSDKSQITEIVIADGVTGIGRSAFKGCSNLTQVSIPESVTGISMEAFSGCSSLETVTIPGGLSSINPNLFQDCTSLKSITIPAGVFSIGSDAFSGCSALNSVTFKGTTPPTTIGADAFLNCPTKGTFNVPDGKADAYTTALKGTADLGVTIGDSNWKVTDGSTTPPSSDTTSTEKKDRDKDKDEPTGLIVEVKEDKSAPTTGLQNNDDQVADMVFDAVELRDIGNGASAAVILTIEDVSENVPVIDKILIDNTIKEMNKADNKNKLTLGMYLDISLFKEIDNDRTQIHNTNGKLKIQIEIPKNLRQNGRNFAIARLHDREFEIITGTYDAKTGMFTFETDRFSTYALVYDDGVSDTVVSENVADFGVEYAILEE